MTSASTYTPVIRRADERDVPGLTMLLVAAFFFGDLASFLIPDASQRSARYYPYLGFLAEQALRFGQVDLIVESEVMPAAAAIWYPVGPDGVLPGLPGYDTMLADAAGPYLPAFQALDTAMHEYHPLGEHDYLAYLAVQPGRQGNGLGSALLEHRHRELDAAGRPAYLEATGSRNGALYQRHGYQRWQPIPVGGGGARLYPMWRDPQP